MIPQSPLEKVARAIAGGEWHETSSPYWMRKAQAALTAILDPDKDRHEVICSILEKTGMSRSDAWFSAADLWEAAIQHMLKRAEG